jgi:hypothetical protein
LNATVYLKYNGNIIQQGDCINGKITFSNVFAYEYTYEVAYPSYTTITDVLDVNSEKTMNLTMDEIIGLPPFNLNVSVDNSFDVTLSWFNYEEYPVTYWNQNWNSPDGELQFPGTWYGVIFDLKDYPYAILTGLDFYHFPQHLSGDCDYVIHIVDIDSKKIIYSTPTLTTTGDNRWENVTWDNIDGYGGKKIGIFLEGKTLYLGMIHNPTLVADAKGNHKNSYSINAQTLTTTLIPETGLGEYLMTLLILDDDAKVELDSKYLLQNFEVFLDDVSQGTTNNRSFVFEGLEEGSTHKAGVKAVYKTKSTETTEKEFTVVVSKIGNVQYSLSYFVDNNGLLTVKTDAGFVNIEVYSMNGQLIKKSEINSVKLPHHGVYTIKATVDGNTLNFKVVW